MTSPLRGSLHHVELRVTDLHTALPAWQWLLAEFGYDELQSWADGTSWKLGATCIVLERSAHPLRHDRRQAGLSHLAFHARDRRRGIVSTHRGRADVGARVR
ncbi:MAG: hypothetical protein LH475_13750 [Cryobacterium sp.]|nr:hypothetical protein [Cryobacterium sp.]MCY7405663.1 hypothetical protein [Cryobacterium sp.]